MTRVDSAPSTASGFRLLQGKTDTLLLFALAVIIYVPLLGWGVPVATGPDRVMPFSTDDILPLGPMAELRNAFVETRPDRNYGYPFWHYFVAGVIQAPYLGYLWLSGELEHPTATFPFGLHDPVGAIRWLTLIGRSVTVLMAAAVVVCVYWFGRILWGRSVGVIAALLSTFNYMLVYYARTGNVDVPAFFWTALGCVVFARVVSQGLTVRRISWLGILAGLAMATKDQALVVFLPLGCALLLPGFAQSADETPRWRTILAGLGASIVAYAVGTGMLVDPKRHLVHVGGLLFHPEWVTVATGPNTARYPATLSGFIGLTSEYLTKFTDTMTLPVALAAAAGLVLAGRRDARHLLWLAPFALLFLLLAVPTGLVIRRYYLPLLLFVDVLAACFITTLWQRRRTGLAVGLCVALLGWRIVGSADLSYGEWADTRYPASSWLAAHARPGDRVEYFGSRSPLPHLSAAVIARRVPEQVERLGEPSTAASILRYLASQPPDWVLIVPDWTTKPGLDRSNDCPEAVYRALRNGSAGYAEVQYFPPVSFLPARLRPQLDYQMVAPPVRIFASGKAAGRLVAASERPIS